MSYAGIGKVLGLDQSRVAQLIQSGELPGRTAADVHRLAIERGVRASRVAQDRLARVLARPGKPYKKDLARLPWGLNALEYALAAFIRADTMRREEIRTAQADADAGVEWRPIYENYEVSNAGQMRHLRFRRVLSPHQREGYSRVSLIVNGRAKVMLVHRAVLTAFVGECPPGMLARHLNGDPGDNRLCNLAWGTPKENSDDKERHGRVPRGERGGGAKLTDEQVKSIRDAVGRQRDIAAQFGVTQSTVGRIRRGEAWSHIE